MAWIDDVSKIMSDNGVPDYIWKPIMQLESGGNPDSVLSNSTEHSVGLFQINTDANPAYANSDLTNPIVNATIAAQNFLSPAIKYLQSRGVSDPRQLAEGVYTGVDPTTNKYFSTAYGGIRPALTSDTISRIKTTFDGVFGGGSSGSSSATASGGTVNLGSGNREIDMSLGSGVTSTTPSAISIEKNTAEDLANQQEVKNQSSKIQYTKIGLIIALSVVIVIVFILLFPKAGNIIPI